MENMILPSLFYSPGRPPGHDDITQQWSHCVVDIRRWHFSFWAEIYCNFTLNTVEFAQTPQCCPWSQHDIIIRGGYQHVVPALITSRNHPSTSAFLFALEPGRVLLTGPAVLRATHNAFKFLPSPLPLRPPWHPGLVHALSGQGEEDNQLSVKYELADLSLILDLWWSLIWTSSYCENNKLDT